MTKIPRPESSKKVTKQVTKKAKKTPVFIKITAWLFFLTSFFLLLLIKKLNVLPFDYFIILTCGLTIIAAILIIFLLKKGKARLISLIIIYLLIIAYSFGIYYGLTTNSFLNAITSDNTSTENYLVIVPTNSSFTSIKDLKNKTLGIMSNPSDSYQQALNTLKKTINYEVSEASDTISLTEDMLNNKTSGMVIEESQSKLLEENYPDYSSKTKVLYTFSISVTEESITKNVDVTKDSFNVFISGIDTYGKITSVSRSDVNIIANINPKTKSITLIHIPRDYYISLYNKSGLKDKLTHAGIYGIDTSVKSVENLLDLDINYYIKFNFTSVIKIVDAIGPISVYSNQNFTTGIYDDEMNETYNFTKGYNTMNGNETLAFCRERHAFADGDQVRGEHQMSVIKAIVKKVTSPSILTKYSKLLSSLSSTFVTNMSENEITTIIQHQLDNNSEWTINSYEMTGVSSNEYTYSYPRQKLYVMVPSNESIDTAKQTIATNSSSN